MGHNSLQVCMDSSSDWLQGSDQSPMDSSSPLSGDILTCSRPLIERRLRPPHDQSLKCPRCDSTHTKFCYYNNYSLSQPRYFCKTCRRYWTKGGTLRNIPVGGGCRKNKKVSSSKKPNNEDHTTSAPPSMNPNSHLGSSSAASSSHHHNPTDLQLSFPDQMQFSHLNNLMLGAQGTGSNINPSFMDASRYGIQSRPIEFMESKLEAIMGSNARNYDFMGSSTGGDGLGVNVMGGLSNLGCANGLDSGFQSFCSGPFGAMSLDHHQHHHGINNNGSSTSFMDTCQRLMLPYEANEDHHHHHQKNEIHDVKPSTKLLSLEWQDQGCSDAGKESSYGGYLNALGTWTGVMNNYGPSAATNSLV